MATVVGVMDVHMDTDVVVLVDPARRTLTWVPRDLWCPALGDRLNQAFKRGGHDGLAGALAENGIAVDHSICVSRDASEAALADTAVEVPIRRHEEYWYPRVHGTPIEEGRKRIAFDPPGEVLRGERVHQWLAARWGLDNPGSDLARIARQQVFLRVLLRQRFDFGRTLELGRCWVSGPGALEEVGRVSAAWRMRTLGGLVPVEQDGRSVLRPTRSVFERAGLTARRLRYRMGAARARLLR